MPRRQKGARLSSRAESRDLSLVPQAGRWGGTQGQRIYIFRSIQRKGRKRRKRNANAEPFQLKYNRIDIFSCRFPENQPSNSKKWTP